MQEYQNTSQGQNLRRKKERQATSPDTTSQPRGHTQHVLQLQRTFGNRKVGQFLQAKRLTPQGMMLGLQRKLTVGAADDQYEQEADRVARQVTNTSDAAVAQSLQRAMTAEDDQDQKIQTKPLAASVTPFVQRQEQGEEKDEAIQTKSSGSLYDSFDAGADVEMQLSQSKGQGSPLPDSVRTYMEPRFGTDFGHVRVHTGSDAVQMNRDVGAQAFTHGSDIYFGEERSPTNLELTAHELTHVVQQTGNLQNKLIARRHDASAISSGPVQARVGRRVVQRAAEDAPRMDAELQACLAAEPFDRMRAAEILNGFNQEDLLARLKPLSAERIAEIHQGALENPALGPDSQVALLTQATPAEVTQGDTGAGGAGPVPPTADGGTAGAPGRGHEGTEGVPGVEVTPETGAEGAGPVPPTTDGGTAGAPGQQHKGPDGGPGVEVPEEIDDEKAVEIVHDALDIAGLAPGPIGVVTDGLNAFIYAEEGDWTNAGLSAASVVLSLGVGMGVGVVLIEGVIKISKTAMAKRGVKAAKEWIADAFKAGRTATKLVSKSRKSLDDFVAKVWEARNEIGKGRDQKRVYHLYSEVDPSDPNKLTKPFKEYREKVVSTTKGRKSGSHMTSDGYDHFHRAGFDVRDPVHLDKIKERIYLNVDADSAPAVMKKVVEEIIDNPDEFPGVYKAKVATEDYIGTCSDGIVIFAESKEAANEVLKRIKDYQSQNPTNFKKSVPWMTEQKAPGVSIGSEPINSGGEVSFGKLRSLAIEQALEEAMKNNKTEEWFKDRVLELFRQSHIDIDNPHLNKPLGGTQ